MAQYASLTVKQLREKLTQRGLENKGRKAELIERLCDADENDEYIDGDGNSEVLVIIEDTDGSPVITVNDKPAANEPTNESEEMKLIRLKIEPSETTFYKPSV